MTSRLTPLQQRFVDAKLLGKNDTEAYQAASPNVTLNTAKREGHRLSTSPKISQQIVKAQVGVRERLDITVDWLVSNYVQTFKSASTSEDWSGARQCLDSLAKLTGLMVDRRETTVTGVIDHQLAAYTDSQLAGVLAEISTREPMLEIEGRVSEI